MSISCCPATQTRSCRLSGKPSNEVLPETKRVSRLFFVTTERLPAVPCSEVIHTRDKRTNWKLPPLHRLSLCGRSHGSWKANLNIVKWKYYWRVVCGGRGG